MKPRTRRIDVKANMDFQSPDPQGVDYNPAPRQHLERAEQRELWKWVQLQPWGDCFAHWPNERQQQREAHGLKLEGVRRGMPDNWLFWPAHGRPGAVSELKRPGVTRSAVKPEQREWLLRLEAQGWAVGVHRGWLEASEFLRDYVDGNWATDGREWWK